MDESPAYPVVPTLVSLWSGMLGGAVGAATGKLSASVILNGLLGFFIGGAASVLLHGMLTGLTYVVVRAIFQAELYDRAIGGYQGDTLASVFGALAGLCGAVVVTIVLPASSLREPHAFTVCWSTATGVALFLALALLTQARGS